MADREQHKGVLKRIVRDFGFIRLDNGKELFIHKNHFPGEMKEGLRVSCEESDPDPKKGDKTHAENIEVLSHGASTASAVTTTASTTKPVPPAPALVGVEEPELETSWEFEEPIQQENLILVRTWITFMRDGSHAHGVNVSLFKIEAAGRETQVLPKKVMTQADGRVYFPVFLTEGTVTCDFIAKVGNRHYTQPWPKNPPRIPPVQQPPDVITTDAANVAVTPGSVTIEEADDLDVIVPINARPDGTFLVRVITHKNGEMKPARFAVLPPQVCTITPLVGTRIETQPGLSRIKIHGPQDSTVELSMAWPHTWFEMESAEHGIMEALIGFEGKEICIDIRCGSVIKHIDLVKPRHLVHALRRQQELNHE